MVLGKLLCTLKWLIWTNFEVLYIKYTIRYTYIIVLIYLCMYVYNKIYALCDSPTQWGGDVGVEGDVGTDGSLIGVYLKLDVYENRILYNVFWNV